MADFQARADLPARVERKLKAAIDLSPRHSSAPLKLHNAGKVTCARSTELLRKVAESIAEYHSAATAYQGQDKKLRIRSRPPERTTVVQRIVQTMSMCTEHVADVRLVAEHLLYLQEHASDIGAGEQYGTRLCKRVATLEKHLTATKIVVDAFATGQELPISVEALLTSLEALEGGGAHGSGSTSTGAAGGTPGGRLASASLARMSPSAPGTVLTYSSPGPPRTLDAQRRPLLPAGSSPSPPPAASPSDAQGIQQGRRQSSGTGVEAQAAPVTPARQASSEVEQGEAEQVHRLHDLLESERNAAQTLEREVQEGRVRLDEARSQNVGVLQQLADAQSEINVLRLRLSTSQRDLEGQRGRNATLQAELDAWKKPQSLSSSAAAYLSPTVDSTAGGDRSRGASAGPSPAALAGGSTPSTAGTTHTGTGTSTGAGAEGSGSTAGEPHYAAPLDRTGMPSRTQLQAELERARAEIASLRAEVVKQKTDRSVRGTAALAAERVAREVGTDPSLAAAQDSIASLTAELEASRAENATVTEGLNTLHAAMESAIAHARAEVSAQLTQAAQAKESQLQAEIVQLRGAVERLQSDVSVEKGRVTAATLAVAQAAAASASTVTQRDLEALRSQHERDVQEQQGRIVQLNVEVQQSREALYAAQGKVESLSMQLAELQAHLSTAETELQASRESKSRIAQLEGQLKSSREELNEALQRWNGSSSELARIRTELGDAHSEVANLKSLLAAAQASLAESSHQRGSSEDIISDLQGSVSSLKREKEELERQYAVGLELVSQMKESVTQGNQLVRSLSAQLATAEERVAAAQASVSEKEKEMRENRALVVRSEKEAERAAEAARNAEAELARVKAELQALQTSSGSTVQSTSSTAQLSAQTAAQESAELQRLQAEVAQARAEAQIHKETARQAGEDMQRMAKKLSKAEKAAREGGRPPSPSTPLAPTPISVLPASALSQMDAEAVTDLKVQLAASQAQLAAAVAHESRQRQEIGELTRKLLSAQESVASTQVRLEMVTAAQAQATASATAASSAAAAVAGKESLDTEVSSLRAELAQAKVGAELSALRTELSLAKGQLEGALAEVVKERKEKEEVQRSVYTLQARAEGAEAALTRAQESYSGTLVQTQAQVMSLQTEVERVKGHAAEKERILADMVSRMAAAAAAAPAPAASGPSTPAALGSSRVLSSPSGHGSGVGGAGSPTPRGGTSPGRITGGGSMSIGHRDLLLRCADLQMQLSSVQHAEVQLQGKLAACETTISGLRADLTKLTAENVELKKLKMKGMSAYAALRTALDAARTRNGKNVEEINDLRGKLGLPLIEVEPPALAAAVAAAPPVEALTAGAAPPPATAAPAPAPSP